MTPEQFKRVEALFHRAKALAPDEQRAMLDVTSGDDAEVRGEVVKLLAMSDPDATILALENEIVRACRGDSPSQSQPQIAPDKSPPLNKGRVREEKSPPLDRRRVREEKSPPLDKGRVWEGSSQVHSQVTPPRSPLHEGGRRGGRAAQTPSQ